MHYPHDLKTLGVTAAAALCASTAAVTAQTPAKFASPVAAIGVAIASPPNAAWVAARMRDGEQLAISGDLSGARRAYLEVVRAQEDAGRYGPDALWHLANMDYGLERTREAARVLDAQGTAAMRFGDPATELEARFNAALLYRKCGDKATALERIERVEELMQSPAIDAQTKAGYASRITRRDSR